jgi:alkylhydroperoxidase family enzyme
MEWYSLRDAVVPIIGKRAFVIFSHAISTQNDCLLCTTFFRKALTDLGLTPESFEPTEEEALLIEFGRAIAQHYKGVPDDLWTRVKARYSEPQLVTLVAFAGQMVATNLFNNVTRVTVDDILKDYVKA